MLAGDCAVVFEHDVQAVGGIDHGGRVAVAGIAYLRPNRRQHVIDTLVGIGNFGGEFT
jgi:hypothetical protein